MRLFEKRPARHTPSSPLSAPRRRYWQRRLVRCFTVGLLSWLVFSNWESVAVRSDEEITKKYRNPKGIFTVFSLCIEFLLIFNHFQSKPQKYFLQLASCNGRVRTFLRHLQRAHGKHQNDINPVTYGDMSLAADRTTKRQNAGQAYASSASTPTPSLRCTII